jgi:hypothetical protein
MLLTGQDVLSNQRVSMGDKWMSGVGDEEVGRGQSAGKAVPCMFSTVHAIVVEAEAAAAQH